MPDAFFLDLDGTLYSGGAPIPGAAAALTALRARGTPCRFLTNTTTVSRTGIAARLRGYGFEVAESEIVTPLMPAVAILKEAGIRTVIPFVPEGALEDLREFELVGGTSRVPQIGTDSTVLPDLTALSALIIGDLGAHWTFDLLQSAFEALSTGARFLALSRDRFFHSRRGLQLDAGPFVVALEFASGREAEVVGKPSAAYYARALATLDPPLPPGRVAMVGDDLWSDIQGAQRAGCQGWLVRTGKFREPLLRDSGIVPDRILTSAADLGAPAT
jgi:HAD superfamily hydrolase (TIGR01458 family)